MTPYRTQAERAPDAPRWPYDHRRAWGRRLLCWLRLGHTWWVLRTNRFKATALAHLHPLAGYDAQCVRCGARWEDSDLRHSMRVISDAAAARDNEQ